MTAVASKKLSTNPWKALELLTVCVLMPSSCHFHVHVLCRYDAFDHIGYDATGAKMLRRKTGDRIDMTIGNTLIKCSAPCSQSLYKCLAVLLVVHMFYLPRRVEQNKTKQKCVELFDIPRCAEQYRV